jgi:hypothetical protein
LTEAVTVFRGFENIRAALVPELATRIGKAGPGTIDNSDLTVPVIGNFRIGRRSGRQVGKTIAVEIGGRDGRPKTTGCYGSADDA